ncbi:hypothetical protein [Klebsiella pneumoniae]
MDGDKIGKVDDNQVIENVTSKINGGYKGLAERKKFTKKAKEMIDDDV